MTIIYHWDVIQRTQEWLDLRTGVLTASEMENIITPAKLQYSESQDTKEFVYELAAQRINKYVEPTYQSYDMMRGLTDEPDAKFEYEKNYALIKDCGFVTNDKWGFTIGFSPDGLVGEDGQVQCKSRNQSKQLRTIVENKMPKEVVIQVQTELLVSERDWSDYISYSGGMYMDTIRVEADMAMQEAIIAAAIKFDSCVTEILKQYEDRINDKSKRLVMTKRRPPEEMILV